MRWQTMAVSLGLAVLVAAPAAAGNDQGKHLPPGLQKKGELPSGWQKKLARGQILDEEVYRHGEVTGPEDARGIVTIRVEDKIIKLLRATREILEVL